MNSTRTALIQHFISIVAIALVASVMVMPAANTAAQGAGRSGERRPKRLLLFRLRKVAVVW
jgi:hypothetical protein